MKDLEVATPPVQALMGIEEGIEWYIAERRSRIDHFVERHFSLASTFVLRKRSFSTDLLCYPVNTLWSVPYLTVKKIGEAFDKLGWRLGADVLSCVPSGIKTAYHREIESMIRKEVLDWSAHGGRHAIADNPFVAILERDPRVAPLLALPEVTRQLETAFSDIDALVQCYSSSRSLISDMASSLLTFGLGFVLFGDHSLGIQGMGERIASKRARDKAVSSFAFGSTLGSAFYSIFPPKPSMWEVVAATTALGFLLTLSGIVIGMVYDPLLKRFGWHDRELHALLDSVEDRLYLLRKRLKPLLMRSAA